METVQQEEWVVRRDRGRWAVDEWQRVLAATHVAFDIRLPTDRPFAGTVVRRQVGVMDLVDCRSTSFAGVRGGSLVREGADRIGVQILRSGTERVSGPNSAALVHRPGALTLWDGNQPVRLEVTEPFVKRTLVFPRDRVVSTCPRLADLERFPALDSLPGSGLLIRYVDAVADELATMDDRMRATAGDITLELLRSMVEPTLSDARTVRRQALRTRARCYILAHLTEPGLGPEEVARALAVSPRTLHAAFRNSGETVAALIRRSRLARAHEDLADATAGTVTEIAFRWGFADATHFSQTFKREYGLPPRDLRARSTKNAGAEVMAD